MAASDARLAARVVAFAVDAVLLTAGLFTVAAAFAAILGPAVTVRPAGAGEGPSLLVHPNRVLLAGVVDVALGAAYFVGSWGVGARERPQGTPGQRLLGIRVGRAATGDRLSLGQASARWVVLMGPLSLGAVVPAGMPMLRGPVTLAMLAWFFVLFLTTACSRTKRGLHDRWAASAVILRPPSAAAPASPPP